MMFVKKNKYFILGIFLLLSLVAYSFYEFYNEYFSSFQDCNLFI